MNKKIIAIATALVVSGGVLIGTASVNASNLSGYESYKTAIQNTANLKNETVDLKLSVKDGSNNLVDVTSNVKVSSATNAMSQATTVKSSKDSETFATYNQAGKSISKSSSSDVYNVRENKHMNFNKKDEKMNPQMIKSVETVVDILSGNMKNNVEVKGNKDGTKKINVKLSENEVAPLVNAIASIAMSKHNDEPMMNEKAGKLDLKNMIPQFESGIKVKSVNVTGDINKDNIISNQVAIIVLSGVDANNVKHEVTINVDLKLSNINSTTPEVIDLTGKQVKTMTNNFNGRGMN